MKNKELERRGSGMKKGERRGEEDND